MEKIEKSISLDEKAYLNIKDAILKCVFPPGEFLAEVRIAEELGVSKTPVRKALARLKQEGFLEEVIYKGHFVTPISGESITELYKLRQVLECYLVGETALEFSQPELMEIEAIIDAADAALEKGEFTRYVGLNRQFHHSFDRKCGNRRISDVLSNLDEHVQRIIFYVLEYQYQEIVNNQRDDHRKILQALMEKDADAAVLRMQRHLLGFCDELVSRLNRSDKAR